RRPALICSILRVSVLTAVPSPGKFGAHVVTMRHSKRSSLRAPPLDVSGPEEHAVKAAAPPTPARQARRFIVASRGGVRSRVLIADQSVRAQRLTSSPPGTKHCGEVDRGTPT